MDEKGGHVFGPVLSRRLGRSLGVDLVPFKVCTFNCIYCQLGRTLQQTTERLEYVSVREVLAEVRARIEEGVKMDHVTLSGSGEPTLHASIGRVIEGIKGMTLAPVAVLTNGSLFGEAEVRAGCARADVVLPTLSAGDDETFQRIHRPAAGVTLEGMVEGLETFRKGFAGEIWLEVFVIAGVNDTVEAMRGVAKLAERIGPERVQLNTAVRPPAEEEARAVTREKLEELARVFGKRGEVIAEFAGTRTDERHARGREDVLALARRRPVTAEEIAEGLGLVRAEAVKFAGELVEEGKLRREKRQGREYYTGARPRGGAGRES